MFFAVYGKKEVEKVLEEEVEEEMEEKLEKGVGEGVQVKWEPAACIPQG